MELHHIALGARDVAGLAEFYASTFALDIVDRHYDQSGELRSVWLRFGEGVLMIEQTTDAPRSVRGVGAGPFLLAFRVSPSERRDLVSQLTEHGIAIEDRTEYTSYFRDPEGNRVAVSHYPLELNADEAASDG